MKLERSAALGAGPYQRTEHRTGYANGYKPKTLHTRLGPLTVEVPQARGVEFYPSALEKGIRSERALKLAVAEMYVQGVSTRKVAAITETPCRLEGTSAEVSRAAQALDEELQKVIRDFLGQPSLVDLWTIEPVEQQGQQVVITMIVPELILGQVHREVLPIDAVAEPVQPLGVAPEALDAV